MTKDELSHVLGRLDKMSGDISNIDKTLSRQEVILDTHIRRTEANEKSIEEFRRFQYRLVGAFIAIQVALPLILKFLI